RRLTSASSRRHSGSCATTYASTSTAGGYCQECPSLGRKRDELGANVAEIVTGEAVVLEVPCARFPSRVLALAIDLAIQLTVVVILLTIVALSTVGQAMDQAAVQATVITVIVLTVVGYPIIWETTTRGRSPGKFALGLRVVSDDGGPVRFRQALVR